VLDAGGDGLDLFFIMHFILGLHIASQNRLLISPHHLNYLNWSIWLYSVTLFCAFHRCANVTLTLTNLGIVFCLSRTVLKRRLQCQSDVAKCPHGIRDLPGSRGREAPEIRATPGSRTQLRASSRLAPCWSATRPEGSGSSPRFCQYGYVLFTGSRSMF